MRKIACITVSIMLLYLCGCAGHNSDVYIFSDMQECREIEMLAGPDVTVKTIETPQNDPYLCDLVYTDYYGCEYTSSDIHFKLYAYSFADSDSANAYFQNGTGITNEREWNFIASTGMFQYERIVINGPNAYVVHTSSADADQVVIFINSIFSQALTVAQKDSSTASAEDDP